MADRYEYNSAMNAYILKAGDPIHIDELRRRREERGGITQRPPSTTPARITDIDQKRRPKDSDTSEGLTPDELRRIQQHLVSTMGYKKVPGGIAPDGAEPMSPRMEKLLGIRREETVRRLHAVPRRSTAAPTWPGKTPRDRVPHFTEDDESAPSRGALEGSRASIRRKDSPDGGFAPRIASAVARSKARRASEKNESPLTEAFWRSNIIPQPRATPAFAKPPMAAEALPLNGSRKKEATEETEQKAFDKHGYRRGAAKTARHRDDWHAEMDVPLRSSTDPRKIQREKAFWRSATNVPFGKSPRIPHDAKRHPDGSRMTEKEFELYKRGLREQFKDMPLDELSEYGRQFDKKPSFARVQPKYMDLALQEEDRRKQKVEQTNTEEDNKKQEKRQMKEEDQSMNMSNFSRSLAKSKKNKAKDKMQEIVSGGAKRRASMREDDDKKPEVVITKSLANHDMIAEMMQKSFGYSEQQVRDGLTTMQASVASPGAWHFGNEFEAHLDPVGALILTRLGAGINPDTSMRLEGTAADLVKQQLENASSMAKSFADRDERNGVRLGDPNYHYRQMIDSVIKALKPATRAEKRVERPTDRRGNPYPIWDSSPEDGWMRPTIGVSDPYKAKERLAYAEQSSRDAYFSRPPMAGTGKDAVTAQKKKKAELASIADAAINRPMGQRTKEISAKNKFGGSSSKKSLVDIYKSGDPHDDEHDKKSPAKCSKCKAPLKSGAKKCQKCGTPTAKR